MLWTKERAVAFLPLLQAVAQGKELQIGALGEWTSATTLDAPLNAYRIKPEPRVCYVLYHGNTLSAAYPTPLAGDGVVKMVEASE